MAADRDRLNELRALKQQQGPRARLDELRALKTQQVTPGQAQAADIIKQEATLQRAIDLPEFSSSPDPNEPTILGVSARGLKTAAGFLTATNPEERINMIQQNFPEAQIRTELIPDGEVTFIDIPTESGVQQMVLNRPGFSQDDALTLTQQIAAFAGPAGLARLGGTLAAKLGIGGLAAAGTQTALETASVPLGGEFDGEDIAIAGAFGAGGEAIGPLLKPVAKAGIQKLKELRQPAEEAVETVARQAQAADIGVDLSKGQATRQFDVFAEEEALRASSSTEGQRARDFFNSQAGQLVDAKNAFLKSVNDSLSLSKSERGEVVQNTIREISDAEKATVKQLYLDLRDLPGGETPLDIRELKTFSEGIMEEISGTPRIIAGINKIFKDFPEIQPPKAPGLGARPLSQRLGGEIPSTGDPVSSLLLRDAEKFRKRFNGLKASDQADIAIVSQIKQAFDGVFESAVTKFPEDHAIAIAAKKARNAHSARLDKFKAKDIIQQLNDVKKGTSDTDVVPSSEVFNKLFSGTKKEENIIRVKKLLLGNGNKNSKAAWTEIKTQGLMDIMSPAFKETPDGVAVSGSILKSQIDKFGVSALKKLLDKKEMDALMNLSKVAGDATIAVPRTTNPAGTAAALTRALGRLSSAIPFGIAAKVGTFAGPAFTAGKDLVKRGAVLDGIQKGASVTNRGRGLAEMLLQNAVNNTKGTQAKAALIGSGTTLSGQRQQTENTQ